MTLLFKLCGCALVGAVCAMTLKDGSRGVATTVAALSSLIIIGAVIARFSDAALSVSKIMQENGAGGYASVMLKSLGVGIVVNTVGSICRDMGETSISNGIELAGKIEILLICLPVITDMLSLIKGILS